MSFLNRNRTPICEQLARLAHYFYCKGVEDGAKIGDFSAVRDICERDDLYSEFQFVFELSGIAVATNIFCAYAEVVMSDLKLNALSHFFSYSKGIGVTKRGILLCCDHMYQKGLHYGLEIGFVGLDDFKRDYSGKYKIPSNNGGGVEMVLNWIKVELLFLATLKDERERYVYNLAVYIGSSIRKNREGLC